MVSFLCLDYLVRYMGETTIGARGFTIFVKPDVSGRRLTPEWSSARVHDDEAALVRRCLSGDQAACAQLVDAYARVVGTMIWRATGDHAVVEDLAQETFLRVFRALGDFGGNARLSTWISTIAHRVAIDHLRQRGRMPRALDWTTEDEAERPIDRVASAAVDPETALLEADANQLVRRHLAALPEKYRMPLMYAAIDGLDYDTIAVTLGIPVGTVKTLVFRAKRLLKEKVAAVMARPGARRSSDAK